MDIGTANVGVKVYTVNGAAAGTGSASSLPDWLKRKRAVKSGRSKRAIREEFEGAVNLIQDFEFPEASNRIRVTRDGHHAIATGVYKPRMKTYDLDQLTLKFERHTDAENVEFLILSDDWTKSIHLQSDRSIELHAQGGLHYRTRIPRFGRALAYHYPSCDALVGGAGNEVYRLNLQQGRFLSPMVLEGEAERGTVQGVNAIDINPAHNLISLATDGPGTVEFWDPRSRTAVGILRLPQSLQSLNSKHSTNLLPELLANEPLAATALSSRMNGLSLAVGTSTGHTLLYDIRSPKPYATKDQGYGFPIKRVQWIEGSSSRMAGDNYVFSADKKVLKVWADDSPETNFASVTTPTDINDVCHVPGSGLFMLANEGIHMTSYYIPQLGPAPKWCSFLDNLTEEMEDQTVRNTYEDFKFLDKDELASLGLDHLLGTPALKPYMHGYFVSLKLYDAARVIANPFVYAEHRQKAIRQKMEKLADSRIRTRKDQLPKVNRALAERILENQEKENRKKRKREEEEEEAEQVEGEEVEMEKKKEKKKVGVGAAALLSDPRFKAVFEDPDFEIDETSKQFALLHPSQADQATNKRKMRTAVDEEDSEGDGGMSSDDLGMNVELSEKESDKEDEESSEEEMEMINLRSGGPQTALMQRKNMPKMVSARPDTSNLSRFKVRDPSATFGQRRQYSGTGNSRKDTTSDQITRANDDGGVTISFVPQSSKNKDIAQRSKENRQKKQGIEYLGAGLERGVEKLEVSEKDRKGRTERRKGVRSGSKNVFRGILIQVSAALQFPVQFLSVYKSMAPNPSPTRLDPEAYPEAPPGLALEQVHVYIRHGERTPVGVRMNRPPASIPEYWPMCFAGRKFSAPVWEPSTILNEAYSAATVDLNRVVELRNGSATPGVCMLGELTDIGRTSTHEYGKALRRLYIERLRFLPDSYQGISPVYYRSTNVPRTIESLQQVINGLYPDGKSPQRPYLLIRNAKDENIIPNHFSCKRLERMAVSFSQAAAEKLNPTLKPLDKRISRYIDGEPVRIDGKPRASGILDTIRAAKAHGIRVPKDFNDPEVMDLIEYAVVQEWFGLGYKNHEYRKLAMGPLLSDLQSKMQKKVDEGEKDPLKLLVYSTHDTALAGIVSALDVFDHRWPEFTASVTFELFKKTPEVIQQSTFLGLNFKWTDLVPSSVGIRGTADVPSPSDYFVRMRYQNNSMTIPHCAKSGNHLGGSPEFCTLKAFQEHIKALTPDDWDAECVPPQPNPTL